MKKTKGAGSTKRKNSNGTVDPWVLPGVMYEVDWFEVEE